jgi:hypothetical protein
MLTLERELREYQGHVAICQGEIMPDWLGGDRKRHGNRWEP